MMADMSNRQLWQHKHPMSSRMYDFKTLLEKNHNIELKTYEDLRQWSVNNLSKFWEHLWHFTHIIASAPFIEVW